MKYRKIAGMVLGALAALSLSAETLVWTGATSSNWNLADVNWTNESGVATAWVNGSDALFTFEAASPVSVAGDVELRNLSLLALDKEFSWTDGGGSLTFITDASTPTNSIVLNNNGKHCHISTRVVCTAPLLLTKTGVLRLDHTNNCFQGGIILNRNQLRFLHSGSIGPGSVAMDAFGTHTDTISVFLDDNAQPAAPDVKFIQNAYSYMGSVNASAVTVKCVGVTEDNKDRVFSFGRVNDNMCTVTLSLTHPDSEEIGQYRLRGGGLRFSLDGGVVKAAPQTPDTLFTTPANLPAPMTARVTNNGVTFDTGGANTELGLSLKFDAARAVTNVLETVYPNNWDFETKNLSGWTVVKNGTTEDSSARNNGSPFTQNASNVDQPAYHTTSGDWFAMIRRDTTMSQTVTLPSAGLWRVVYERGCRPNNSYPSWAVDVTVSLGGDGNATLSPAQSSMYPFRREETALFDLEAGSQLLKFVVGPYNGANTAVLFDAIRLERCEVVPVPVGPLVKTGIGSLAITNLVTEGFVAVSNGTLVVRESTLEGTTVDVADGGTLALYATRLTNATVNVAAGGAVALHSGSGMNLVVNGSFEANVVMVSTGSQPYDPGNGPTGWTFDNDRTAVDPSGIQKNYGNMSSTYGAYTVYGQKTAYMRKNTTMSQTVEVPAAGLYEVSILQGCRKNYQSYGIPLTLAIDGVVVVSNAARTALYDFERHTARVTLTAGEHTLVFATGDWSPSYSMLFIDDVHLELLAGTNALEGNELAFASGATLDLQNVEPIYLAGGVTVDGREVKGSEKALRRAGVNVTGTGLIQIGPPQGTVLLFR